MKLLAIETSCDETAAAVVSADKRIDKRILAHVVLSQIAEHAPYQGVVPEIAARAHMEHLDRLITETMQQAALEYSDLDGVAVTAGPGLIGGLIVGLMVAKGIAHAAGKPFIPVNHLEGHALTVRLTHEVEFPFLLLLVSGGHCQLLSVAGVGRYRRLGGTMDDALGEAFDKVAKMLGLGYPGGPVVERLAELGNPARFAFPRPLIGKPNCDFSFSGLKTAVKRQVDALEETITKQDVHDLCASFQAAAADVLVDRLRRALELFTMEYPASRTLVLAGGVAANRYIRARLETAAAEYGFTLVAPPLALCTDNAAMIGWAGIERLRLGLAGDLSFAPRPRWPLEELAQDS